MQDPPFDLRRATPDCCPICERRYDHKHSARHQLVLQDEAADASVRNDRLGGQLCGRCWRHLRAKLGAVGTQTPN